MIFTKNVVKLQKINLMNFIQKKPGKKIGINNSKGIFILNKL